MFDLGWSELLVIGVVALIVVGPKDLPVLFRNVGRYMGKARVMAREFSRAMEAAADEAGVKDIDRTLKAAVNPKALGLDALRDAAGLREPPAMPARAAVAPVTAAAASILPGGETEALVKKRATDKAEVLRKVTERAADRALAETPAPDTGVPGAPPAGPDGSGKA